MNDSQKTRNAAEAVFQGPPEQPAKGSASGMIAAETKAMQEKTARLRKLRMARDASVEAEAAGALAQKGSAKTKASGKSKPAARAARSAKISAGTSAKSAKAV